MAFAMIYCTTWPSRLPAGCKQSGIAISLLGGDFGEIMFLYYCSRIDGRYEAVADGLLDKM